MTLSPHPASQPAPPRPKRAPGSKKWRISLVERGVHTPGGSLIRLTATEFETLLAMASKPGRARSRAELTKIVFGRIWRPGDRGVDNAVLHLRRKLAAEPGAAITTVRRFGYALTGFPRQPR